VDYPYNGTCEEFLAYTRDVVPREDWHKFRQRFNLREMRRVLTKTGDKLEMELRRKNGGDGFISAGLQRFEKTTGGPGGAFY
jgi:hypothetical protein